MLTPPPVPARETGYFVEAALAAIGMSKKEACALMGISEFEFSRQINHRGVNLARLRMLGPRFMQALFMVMDVEPPVIKAIKQRLESLELTIGGTA